MAALEARTMATALLILALLLQTPPAVPGPVTILAELKKEITSRRSKAGQDVRLVVTENILAADGSVLIPSGAKLSGKIAVAHKRSGGEPAALGFVVDKAEWKDGSMPLNATIERLQVLGSTDSSSCGPNLNRGGLSACGGAAANFVPVPSDCSVEKVGDSGQMAVACKKREVELGPGTVFMLKNSPPKT
jgi:hypothetical protein